MISFVEEIKKEVHRVIVGKEDIIEFILIAIFAQGHVLMEGVPGIAKTKMANTIAKVLDLEFKRVQFTPDLLPADITGTMVYNMATKEFELKKGPVFTNILLADEINRASPKTQSALLECMQEKQVTIGNKTYKLPFPFIVLATQNPLEMEGVYPLPEAQIDRFLFKLNVSYPTKEEEIFLIKERTYEIENLRKILSAEDILKLSQMAKNEIKISDELIEYIVNIIFATRNHHQVYLGASPRATIALMETSKILALFENRNYVIPDDIKKLSFPILRHRLILTSEAEMGGIKPDKIISDILQSVPVPKSFSQ